MDGSSQPSPIRVERADSDYLYDHVFRIRAEVFVEEVEVDDEEDYDGFDHLAHHYLAWYEGEPAGTARWRSLPGSGKIRLERFAVLQAFRGKGIGGALVEQILNDVPKKGEIFIHAQVHNLPFYEKFGFEVEGEPFEEAGLMHCKMIWRPTAG
ncbi:MAG: GNAT family N-acetyltransferase [Bacteroidetes bacterium]|nr:MAG: GNAT family N-acetyltransferase [Bacteroidota bacterium]